MEPFSLEKYLENPSRKVVTRRGNPVRIICTDRKHGEDNLPIVFLEQCHNGEFLLACRKDGRGDTYDTPYDLFFVDEEDKSQSIEIPFGAKDSEFVRDEYLIPEGCEARIEGNKVIIEKIQKNELTEFEKAIKKLIESCCNEVEEAKITNAGAKEISSHILDLARKEIRKEQQEKLGTLEMPIDVTEPYYIKGKQDALKDLPKWKKMPNGIQGNNKLEPKYLIRTDYGFYFTSSCLSGSENNMYIELVELENLPKE